MFFLLLVQKKERKKSTPGNDLQPLPGRPDVASVLLLTGPNNSNHLHNLNLKDESHASCSIVISKGAVFRPCIL
jgi:hypothetical protein